jgi:hypothetical protein
MRLLILDLGAYVHCMQGIKEWHKNTSCVGKASVVYKDLRDCDNDKKIASGPLAGQPCKNDSAMWDTYNTYSNGHGGCCAAWSGDQSPYGPMGNYFCGNSSAGGWVSKQIQTHNTAHDSKSLRCVSLLTPSILWKKTRSLFGPE